MKDYLVTFRTADQRVTYPITASSKQEAKRKFSKQYIGVYSQCLEELLECTEEKCKCGAVLSMGSCPVCE